MSKIVGLITSLMLVGCGVNECYPEANSLNYTSYKLAPLNKGGILVDDPKGEVDLTRLSRKISAVSECVQGLPLDLPPEAQCYGQQTREVRACLVIKVAPDWHISQCSKEEVFPCNVPWASCAQKGIDYTPECPCSCRAIIQDNSAIITTPNLKLLPAQLTSLLTGCYYPWVGPLATCANPSIGE